MALGLLHCGPVKLVAALLVVLAGLGCKGDPKITGVRIQASWGPGRVVDQLAFALEPGLGSPHFDAETVVVRPVTAGAPLRSPQDFVIYLPDDQDGQWWTCGVAGRRAGRAEGPAPSRAVQLKLHTLKLCPLSLDEGVDAAAGTDATGSGGLADGASGDGALAEVGAGPDAGGSPDGSPTVDGTVPPDTGPSPDASPSSDQAPRSDVGPPPVDAPVSGPPDVAVDRAPPPPDLPVQTGCADGVRHGFPLASYDSIASCGPFLMTYSEARTMVSGVCAGGWHWCSVQEIGAVPAGAPAPGSGACSWLKSEEMGCSTTNTTFSQLLCGGSPGMTVSAGGPNSGVLACAGVDLGCTQPWKYATSFDSWSSSSLSGNGCMNHVGFRCASAMGGSSCWITCCK
jgi:hypothetical protein